jgi:hypothetical protein
MTAKSCPFLTRSPRVTCSVFNCPDTCAPTSTLLKAFKVPLAKTVCSRSIRMAGAVIYAIRSPEKNR